MSLKAIILLAFLCSQLVPLFARIQCQAADVRPDGFLIFLHTVFMTSTLALPIVLANSPTTAQIQWGACGLTLTGCLVMYGALYTVVYQASRDSSL
ncbi:Leptin receptor overlapping transcript-like 1 [Sparganum proliferum]